MNILILGHALSPKFARNTSYRGTYRPHPTYCKERAANDEINLLFAWFIDEGGQLGVVRDVSKALSFAQLWNEQLGEKAFEVVEVVHREMKPVVGAEFYGYDLSQACNNSLLAGWKMSPCSNKANVPIATLAEVVFNYFTEKLNEKGLFDRPDVAASCLCAMKAVQVFWPNCYEGGALDDFDVVGICGVAK
jgi:hypothetical protein